jgi:hypothetical protein
LEQLEEWLRKMILELVECRPLAQLIQIVQEGCSPRRNPTTPYLPMQDPAGSAHTSHRRAIHWVQRIHQNDLLGYSMPTLALSPLLNQIGVPATISRVPKEVQLRTNLNRLSA